MTRVLVVGAGPAGIRAAQTLAEAGLRPIVVDEAARAGGQIYRRPPEGSTRKADALYGSEAAKAVALHRLFDRLAGGGKVAHLANRSVVALADGTAHLLGEGHETIPYDRLILATGAMDRVAPVPGWEAGGVFTLGAAQIALKAQGIALGKRIVLAGTGPLLTLVAHQLIAAGAKVAAVLDTAPVSAQVRGGVGMALARPVVTLRGLRLRIGLGVRYRAGVTLERIETEEGPTAIRWRDWRGRAHRTVCDTVALGWHLCAETHLAELAGAAFDWSETFAQWLPRCDAFGRAGEGLYLAGDGQRLLGADGAECAGRLAAIACLADLGHAHPDPAPLLRRRARLERFAGGVARAFPWPGDAVRSLPDESVICRCENIRAGEVRAIAAAGGADINRVKSLGRIGMGRCQGRYCESAGAEIVASVLGLRPADAGRLRAQPPARPVPAGAWTGEAD